MQLDVISLGYEGTDDNNYSVIISKQMVGLMLFIFVRQDIQASTESTELAQFGISNISHRATYQGFISNKETTAIGCGKAGAGNKGAVVARFQVQFCLRNLRNNLQKILVLQFNVLLRQCPFSSSQGHQIELPARNLEYLSGKC